MSGRRRDDFSKKDVEIIAKRAGYICSFPSCGVPTIGPATTSQDAVNLGEAAHIYGASPNGPRYSSSQTAGERRSPENGIWLCRQHAKLIDADEQNYPPEKIFQMKNEHEQRIRVNLGKPSQMSEIAGEHTAKGVGVVTGLDIVGPAIIRPGTRVIAEGIGKVTGTRIGPPHQK